MPVGITLLHTARTTLRNRCISVLVFSCFVNLLMLTGPIFMLQVYERVLSSRSEQTLLALFLLVVILYAIMGYLDHIRSQLMARAGAGFQDELSDQAFRTAIAQSIRAEGRRQPAAALRDLDQIQSALSSPGPLAIMDLPWLPIYLLVIYLFHPWLGLLATAGGAAIVTLAWLGQLTTRRLQGNSAAPTVAAANLEQSAWRDAETVKALGMQGAVVNRWRAQKQAAQLGQLSHTTTAGAFRAGTKAFRLLLQSAMLALGAYLVLQNEITAGVMIVGSIMMGRALAPVDQLTGSYAILQKALQAYRELGVLFSGPSASEAQKPQLPQPQAHVQATNLAVGPPGTIRPLVRGVNFEIRPGEALGIIGPSGSGKSSVATTLAGVWAPIHGELRIGGATYNQWDGDQLGGLIGYLPQKVTLFQGTVAENIARFDPEATMEGVVRAAQTAEVHDMILGLPNGYDTEITAGSGGVSGGQALRIGLARALYGDPVFVILDEPNAFLDARGEEALFGAIRALKQAGTAVVIIAHSPRMIVDCENTLILVDGQQRDLKPTHEMLNATRQIEDQSAQETAAE